MLRRRDIGRELGREAREAQRAVVVPCVFAPESVGHEALGGLAQQVGDAGIARPAAARVFHDLFDVRLDRPLPRVASHRVARSVDAAVERRVVAAAELPAAQHDEGERGDRSECERPSDEP